MSVKLYQLVLSNSKKSFQAKKDDNGKQYNTIANNGLKKDCVALRSRDGEYTDFTIKVLEDVKPLLTDIRIARAIKILEENDIQSSIKVLYLENEVIKHGINIIYSVLKLWLEKNEINIPHEYKDKAIDITNDEFKELKKWILTTRSDPLNAKIQIVNIGKSKKGHSVVPDDWLGREFNNAVELHSEMDKLDWRKGKPPVNYCCIYSMIIKEIYTWKNNNDSDIINFEPEFCIEIKLNKSQIINFKNINYGVWLNSLTDNIKVLICNDKNQSKYIIACELDKIIRKNLQYSETDNVGYLVSKLQKCIRRGRKCSKLLYESINQLNKAKPYNLPEQQFVKVSGSRQLCWRLFITVIEDVEPYLDDDEYYGLLDLLSLGILCHNDHNIQFNDDVINKLAYTALLIQYNDDINHNWDWRKGKEINNIEFNNKNDFIKLALKCMPMMSGDNKLLKKSIDHIETIKLNKLNKISLDDLLKNSDNNAELECKYASNDMHCNPNILLYLQASFPFVPYEISKHSTYGLSSFIWENSSKYNVRNGKLKKISKEDELILKSLKNIQEDKKIILDDNIKISLVTKDEIILDDNKNISELESRIGFLLLFGKKIRLAAEGKNKSIEIIVCGDNKMPCKIKRADKYLEGKERYDGECRYVDYLNKNNIIIKLPNPPEGCKWNLKDKKVRLNAKIINTDKNNYVNDIEFYINNIKLEPFNTNKILTKNSLIKEVNIPECIEYIIKQCLYNYDDKDKLDEWNLNKLIRELWKLRYDHKNYNSYKWKQYNKIDNKVWKCLHAKFYNNYNDEVTIGPIDRSGNKLHDSINYLYEGTILRLMNMLSLLYPNVIVPKTALKFIIHKNENQYNNLMKILDELALVDDNKHNEYNINIPKIKTKLWDHQEKSSNEIYDNIINKGKRGHGDASNVGSGKTLTALNVICKLAKYNIENNINKYKGFLVLLPTIQLYQTWKDEINKHTYDFDIIEQYADGKLTKNTINNNSIIITTLGRNRDHPLSNSWTLVIIDECLSVQNKEAFQTEEAFKQILSSQYGVIMMSATFFRSRFDKLFYMIKMLRSGLPEEKDYLDTILNECIICNISQNDRKWNTGVNKFKLNDNLKNEYNNIQKQDMSSEHMYIKLSKLLYDKFDYINCFEKVIQKIETENRRALIYAKSKEEADEISKIKNVSRYPDKNGKHTVLSYVEGTYGLNDLIIYDTIITRPPNPDALPQMKGRLNRPGNKNNILYIEYILAEDTIDEAGLIRLELCNNFYKSYILPLADFYDLAIGKKKLNDIKNNPFTLNNKKIMKIAKKSNVIIIDDDSIAISEQNTYEKKERKIDTLIKIAKDQRYYNIVVYNENIMEIDRMKNDFKNFKNILST